MSAERFRQQLGAELRGLRTMAGLSQNDIRTDEGSIPQVTVSRYERGERLPTRAEVYLWFTATGATDENRQRVLALFEAAHVPERIGTPTAEDLAQIADHAEAIRRLVRGDERDQ